MNSFAYYVVGSEMLDHGDITLPWLGYYYTLEKYDKGFLIFRKGIKVAKCLKSKRVAG